MENRFHIEGDFEDGFGIEKDGVRFGIGKRIDGDIWFSASSEIIELPIRGFSREEEEYETFQVFENLMKLIIGRYYLSGDAKSQYNCLPKDFIDSDQKTITWHSDSGREDILRMQLRGNDIVISLLKDMRYAVDSARHDQSVRVRIRTSGSEYGYYYQEFEKFYRELSQLTSRMRRNPPQMGTVQKQKTTQTP